MYHYLPRYCGTYHPGPYNQDMLVDIRTASVPGKNLKVQYSPLRCNLTHCQEQSVHSDCLDLWTASESEIFATTLS